MNILIIDDSAVVRNILKQVFAAEEGFTVIGEASNGEKAVDLTLSLGPDVVIMDINMPVLNGIDATRSIMERRPTPILIFSTEINVQTSFEAMRIGAVDVMLKPDIDAMNDTAFRKAFLEKLRAVAKARLLHAAIPVSSPVRVPSMPTGEKYELVVIGASTGGPLAVKTILDALPADFSVGIAVVQHLEAGFDRGYASWLNESSHLTVRLAGEREFPRPGEVLIAPVDRHLVAGGGALNLDDGPKVLNQKPAVDCLFSTAARAYGRRLVGVLLTGMGRDGAAGCKDIVAAGGVTLVQDEQSSAIYGMPKAAAELGAASEILPLDLIAGRLSVLVG